MSDNRVADCPFPPDAFSQRLWLFGGLKLCFIQRLHHDIDQRKDLTHIGH